MCSIFFALIGFLQFIKKTNRCSSDLKSPLCQLCGWHHSGSHSTTYARYVHYSTQQFLNSDVLYSSLFYHIAKFLPKLMIITLGWSNTQYKCKYKYICILALITLKMATRGGVRSTRGLGPTMTARGQSISISIGMLPQTLIMSRLDQLSQLGERI